MVRVTPLPQDLKVQVTGGDTALRQSSWSCTLQPPLPPSADSCAF